MGVGTLTKHDGAVRLTHRTASFAGKPAPTQEPAARDLATLSRMPNCRQTTPAPHRCARR
ncbi:hypothetical protein CCU68_17690 [Pseudomonas gingeri NCPPB 3146 = LMG 5327]|uniref:DUF1534 domain-containing protein n=1 Tax=Pseudomonas gingeri NCPPB 3146 = LMG 5327 TaxID=707248 RepID=A0ABX4Y1F4_9PSED|nr:hypothetical protein CCU68_17690 [Pseudomonas gingeri NCPPB 3146 = LMG 5327]